MVCGELLVHWTLPREEAQAREFGEGAVDTAAELVLDTSGCRSVPVIGGGYDGESPKWLA